MAQSSPDPDTLRDSVPSQVSIYTDGGCDPNPGPGGWGAIIRWEDREWVLSGNDPGTTNNRMELYAAAAALALLEGLLGHCKVTIYTDSQYVRQGTTEWLDGWQSQGWRTSNKHPVKNQDLWRVLYRFTQAHDITWHWLKGHAGHPLNERADKLATEALHALRHRQPAPEAVPPPDDDRPTIEVYIKASCRGAENRGGWAAVLRTGEHTRSLSGGESATTANAMLIRGATEALAALTRPCRVALFSDADYLIKGASMWIKGWQARGWRTREGKSVGNRAEWEALLVAAQPHYVTWQRVRGDDTPADLSWAGELAAQASRPDEAEA